MKWFSSLAASSDRVANNNDPDIGNVYDDLKERISNPLITSFLISFFFCNWKVWVCLFFESEHTVKAKGFDGYVEYLNCLLSIWSSLIFPLLIAVGYVFVFPYIRNCIRVFQARRITENNREINDIAKGGVVLIDFYIKAKKDLLRVQKEHQGEVEEHLNVKTAWAMTETRLKEFEKKEVDLLKEIESLKFEKGVVDKFRKFSKLDFFIGRWLVSGYFVNAKAAYIFIDEKGTLFLGAEYVAGIKDMAIGNITDINYNLNDMTVRVDFKPLSINSKREELFKLGYLRFSRISEDSMQQILEKSTAYFWRRTSSNVKGGS